MLNLNRILVPIDFSATAADARRHARALARRFGADLHLLHVTRGQEFNALTRRLIGEDAAVAERLARHVSGWLGLSGAEARAAQSGMSDEVQPSSVQSGRFVRAVRRARVPRDGILTYAQEIDAELIVIGTSGRGTARGPLLGSVADQVIRRASRSVVTVRPDLDAPPPDHEDAGSRRLMVVPIDFSWATRSLIAHAKHWAETFEAQVDFLHVAEPPGSSVFAEDKPSSTDSSRAKNARSRLRAAVEATEGPDVNVTTRVLVGGDVASRIVEYAEAQRAHLLLMAAHGLSSLRKYILGGVTDRVIRGARCPVCTLKSYERSLVPTEQTETGAA